MYRNDQQETLVNINITHRCRMTHIYVVILGHHYHEPLMLVSLYVSATKIKRILIERDIEIFTQ